MLANYRLVVHLSMPLLATDVAHQDYAVNRHGRPQVNSFPFRIFILLRGRNGYQPGKGGLQAGILFSQVLFHFVKWRIVQNSSSSSAVVRKDSSSVVGSACSFSFPCILATA